ncbi:StAR-related lipid transfer protein 8 [Thelohanellus kitauei]|uniref:StAR-related lipid transfer protein 8 n=1 Tax=Thelohanellus kitauei TaxID=669202 RepID=A0A0C2N2D4_THEKT|nr:StAR-related lipid transfer protein 8 [Thelohanellus kitauei]
MTQIKSITAIRLNSILKRDQKMTSTSSKRVTNLFRKLFNHEEKSFYTLDIEKVAKNSLQWYIQRYGCPFPPLVIYIIDKITREGLTSEGIFRRSGRKSNINILEKMSIEDIIHQDLSPFSIYDFADYLKLFMRGLPEAILVDNISSIFTTIHSI